MSVSEALNKSDGNEPKSPYVAQVTDDGNWTVPIQGGKLKRGGSHNRPGRPKAEVRQGLLNVCDTHAARIIAEELAKPNLLPAERAKWLELALRFGLGTQDEVKLSNGQVIDYLADVLASHADQVSLSLAKQIVSELKELSGLK